MGTYGIASAQYHWGRMAALILRILYHTFPQIIWAFVFVDDFAIYLPTDEAPTTMMAILCFLHTRPACRLEKECTRHPQHLGRLPYRHPTSKRDPNTRKTHHHNGRTPPRNERTPAAPWMKSTKTQGA